MIRRWCDGKTEYLQAWGIVPDDVTASRVDQVRGVFAAMERTLAAAGMNFRDHVVRTWFYIDRINDWYADFNATRTEFFESRGVFAAFLPASTGIGHTNPFGAALTVGFVAARPLDGSAPARRIVKSPLQTDAMTYRSSFSRAAELTRSDGRILYVSGTAAILPQSSEVAFVGDVELQMSCAMRAALAIVESRGMTAANVTRMIVYLKHPESRPVWEKFAATLPLKVKPTVMEADVCRDDWLFEVELDSEDEKGA